MLLFIVFKSSLKSVTCSSGVQQLRPRSLNPFLLCASLDIYHPLIFYSHLTPADDFLSAPRSQALIPEALAHVGVLLGHILIFTFDHGLCSPSHTADGEYKDVCSSSPVRTPKLQLTAEPSTREFWIPPKIKNKKIPHVQGQRRSKIVGGVKSSLESNSIPSRDTQGAQTKPSEHPDPEIPQRLS